MCDLRPGKAQLQRSLSIVIVTVCDLTTDMVIKQGRKNVPSSTLYMPVSTRGIINTGLVVISKRG